MHGFGLQPLIVHGLDDEHLASGETAVTLSSSTTAAPSMGGQPGRLSVFSKSAQGWGNQPDVIRRDQTSEIVPGFLFMGSARAANSAARMEELGITAYLCVAAEARFPDHLSDEQLRRGERAALRLPMEDGVRTQLQDHFREAFAFLQQSKREGRRVIVYCREGKSRSASIVIAYLMARSGLSYEDAFLFVRSKRSAVDPNYCFCSQLQTYSQRLAGRSDPDLVSPSPEAATPLVRSRQESLATGASSELIHFAETDHSLMSTTAFSSEANDSVKMRASINEVMTAIEEFAQLPDV